MTAVTPLLMQWSYHSLVLSHRYGCHPSVVTVKLQNYMLQQRRQVLAFMTIVLTSLTHAHTCCEVPLRVQLSSGWSSSLFGNPLQYVASSQQRAILNSPIDPSHSCSTLQNWEALALYKATDSTYRNCPLGLSHSIACKPLWCKHRHYSIVHILNECYSLHNALCMLQVCE